MFILRFRHIYNKLNRHCCECHQLSLSNRNFKDWHVDFSSGLNTPAFVLDALSMIDFAVLLVFNVVPLVPLNKILSKEELIE